MVSRRDEGPDAKRKKNKNRRHPPRPEPRRNKPMDIRRATDNDRLVPFVAALGNSALANGNVLVAYDGDDVVGVAIGSAPRQGDTAALGEIRFREGVISAGGNFEALRALLRAHVKEAIARGFKKGDAVVHDARIMRFVRRTFGVHASEYGRNPETQQAVSWRFEVVLADFLRGL